MFWFKKATELNRYDAQARIGLGMCLDWLGRHEEASPYFKQAYQLNPNHYSVSADVGWHHFQIQDYAAAKRWLEQSVNILYDTKINSNAWTRLRLAKEKLASSTNQPAPPRLEAPR